MDTDKKRYESLQTFLRACLCLSQTQLSTVYPDQTERWCRWAEVYFSQVKAIRFRPYKRSRPSTLHTFFSIDESFECDRFSHQCQRQDILIHQYTYQICLFTKSSQNMVCLSRRIKAWNLSQDANGVRVPWWIPRISHSRTYISSKSMKGGLEKFDRMKNTQAKSRKSPECR